MTSESTSLAIAPEGVLLTSADLQRWEREARELEVKATSLRAEANTLDGRAAAMKARVSAALELIAIIRGDGTSLAQYQDHLGASEPREGTWVSVLLGWINEAPDGLNSADLHRLIDGSPEYSAKYAASDKGYYHALSRLRKAGRVIQKRGRYYSLSAFESSKVSADGQNEGNRPGDINYRRSPMGEAILDLVSCHPGILGKEIVERLRADDEFREKVNANDTGVYNAIARLIQRGQIDRRGSACFPGPDMPARNPESKWLQGPPVGRINSGNELFAGGLQ